MGVIKASHPIKRSGSFGVRKEALRVAVLLAALFTIAASQVGLHAQGDAYDPFIDYSEFEDSREEEADIHFFKTGRLFTMNFMGGYRYLTGNQRTLYRDAGTFGLGFTFFFDMRFAMQFQYLIGDHTINYATSSESGEIFRLIGTQNIQDFGLSLKYFFNTQSLVRGLASLNPYIIFGASSNNRETRLSGQVEFAKDSATGFDFGGGLEVPMLRNKMFFGFQATYKIISWPEESQEVIVNETIATGLYPDGDMAFFAGILGLNF